RDRRGAVHRDRTVLAGVLQELRRDHPAVGHGRRARQADRHRRDRGDEPERRQRSHRAEDSGSALHAERAPRPGRQSSLPRLRRARFATDADIEIQGTYGSTDAPAEPPGPPGQFPFTRGVQETMYRGQLWTMRQYAGFGTAAESNRRYKYLLAQGGKG